MEQDKDFRHIIRISNTDLDGNKAIMQAMRNIKGVSFMFANMVCSLASVEGTKKVGYLSDAEIKKIEDVLKNPFSFGAPAWMANRRKDMVDGQDKHLLSSDLSFVQDNDIKMLKKMRCYKGVRHMAGLPVRGQRTKSNFRKNKGKVHLGVKKRSGAKAGRV